VLNSVIAEPTASQFTTTAKELSTMLLNNVKRYLPHASLLQMVLKYMAMEIYANSTKVNGNTIFDIASITKTFTTTLLADMVKQGLVNLDDPIEKYLPATVKAPTYNRHKITLGNLATRTSGLPDFPAGWIRNHTYTTPGSIIFFQILHSKVNQEPRLTILILVWVFWAWTIWLIENAAHPKD